MNNEQIKKLADSQFEYVHGYGYMLNVEDLLAFAQALLASEQTECERYRKALVEIIGIYGDGYEVERIAIKALKGE